jgi:hypothetical protein
LPRQRIELTKRAKAVGQRTRIERGLSQCSVNRVDAGTDGRSVTRLTQSGVELIHHRGLNVIPRRVAACGQNFLVEVLIHDALDVGQLHAGEDTARRQCLLLCDTPDISWRVHIGDVVCGYAHRRAVRRDGGEAAGNDAVQRHGAPTLHAEDRVSCQPFAKAMPAKTVKLP